MKKTFLLLCSTALFFSACNSGGETDKPKTDSGAVPKETGKTEAPAPPMDSAAMMKAWQDFATPGAMHKWMERTNGTWEDNHRYGIAAGEWQLRRDELSAAWL